MTEMQRRKAAISGRERYKMIECPNVSSKRNKVNSGKHTSIHRLFYENSILGKKKKN